MATSPHNAALSLYHQNLYQLFTGPVQMSGPPDLKDYCPHLTDEQIGDLFDTAQRSDKWVYFSVPPTHVKRSYHVLCLKKTQEMVRLNHALVKKTKESYADGNPEGAIGRPSEYCEKAMSFAEQNWPEELVTDDWKDVVAVVLRDLDDFCLGGCPKCKATAFVSLSRSWDEIGKDRSDSFSSIWERAIQSVTLDLVRGLEQTEGHRWSSYNTCSSCGWGLWTNKCDGCGKTFEDKGFLGVPARGLVSIRIVNCVKALHPELLTQYEILDPK